jgi:hypothetical protein
MTINNPPGGYELQRDDNNHHSHSHSHSHNEYSYTVISSFAGVVPAERPWIGGRFSGQRINRPPSIAWRDWEALQQQLFQGHYLRTKCVNLGTLLLSILLVGIVLGVGLPALLDEDNENGGGAVQLEDFAWLWLVLFPLAALLDVTVGERIHVGHVRRVIDDWNESQSQSQNRLAQEQQEAQEEGSLLYYQISFHTTLRWGFVFEGFITFKSITAMHEQQQQQQQGNMMV